MSEPILRTVSVPLIPELAEAIDKANAAYAAELAALEREHGPDVRALVERVHRNASALSTDHLMYGYAVIDGDGWRIDPRTIEGAEGDHLEPIDGGPLFRVRSTRDPERPEEP